MNFVEELLILYRIKIKPLRRERLDKRKGGSMNKVSQRILTCDELHEARVDKLRKDFTEILLGAFIGVAAAIILMACCFV